MEKEIIVLKPSKDSYKFLPMTSSFVDNYEPEEMPEDIRPTFKLKPLTISAKRDLLKIQTALTILSEKMVHKAIETKQDDKDIDAIIDSLDQFNDLNKANEKLVDIARKFVKGWTNFKDIDGNEFEFKEDSEGFLRLDCFLDIPVPLQSLIINRITEISNLNESEQLGLK